MTLEGYWLMFNQVMETRTDIFAKILALYGRQIIPESVCPES